MSKTTVRAGLSAGRPHKVLTMTGVMAAILAMHTPVCAGADATLPIISAVQAGSVSHSVNEAGTVMNIVQTTQRAVVNYDSFNIGRQATVNHTGGLLLGRVTGGTASRIDGTLNTSGLVLVNPNGIAIGSTANINAGSFTASTFNISNDDFMAGRLRFERSGTETGVLNEGTINTKGGGYVVLVGASVDNHGRIATEGGDVVLASGQTATISVPLSASGRVRLELDAGALNAAVANHAHGVIVTHGGHVLMRAAAVVDAASAGRTAPATVTHMGQIDTTGDQGGRVDVLADHGMVRVGGSITANSTGTHTDGSTRAGGDIYIGRDEETHVLAAVGDSSGATLESKAGFVETSGQFLATYGTRVMAKDWLLDPVNITIAASGAAGTPYGDSDGATAGVQYNPSTGSTILASDIVANLNAGTNVFVSTAGAGTDAGNITVNADIVKTTTGTASLSLRADNNITVNNRIAAGVGATGLSVTLRAGQSSATTTTGQIVIATGGSIEAKAGNVILQTKGGMISNASGATVTGTHITLDNTNGAIDVATGSITKGTSSGASGTNAITIGENITATGNLRMYGLTANNMAISLAAAKTLSGGNIQAVGENAAVFGFSMGSGASIVVTASSGSNLITAIGRSTGGGGAGTLSLTNATFRAATGSTLDIKGQAVGVTGGAPGNTRGIRIDGVIDTYGAITLTGESGSTEGVLVQAGNINIREGSLTINGTMTPNGGGWRNGVNIARPIFLYNNTDLTIVGKAANTGAMTLNQSEIGVGIDGVIASAHGQTGRNVSITGFTSSAQNSFGVVLNGSINTGGNIQIIGQNLGSSTNPAVRVNSNLTSGAGDVTIQSIGGRIEQSTSSTITARHITIDNTGAGLNSLITDTTAGLNLAEGTAMGGSIDPTTRAITPGAGQHVFPTSATAVQNVAVSVSGALAATGNINIHGAKSIAGTGVDIASAASLISSGVGARIQLASNRDLAHAGAIRVTGSNGTGATIGLTSSLGGVTGLGVVGNSTHKNAAVNFSQGATSTYGGTVHASTFAKNGEGRLQITGSLVTESSNSINQGTLQIGTGGTAGSMTANTFVASGAALEFNRSDAYTMSAVVSGAGSLIQSGTGTTTLTADNSYSGVTSITGGTLQVGNGGSTGSLGSTSGVTLSNNTQLTFNRSVNTTIDRVIGGNGNVTANITGHLVLGSDVNLTGTNSINLTASGSITRTAGSLAATNLILTATSGGIGAADQRIQTNVANLSVSAGGDVFVTEANAVLVAGRTTANNGNLDIRTTNGTLHVGSFNSLSGLTAHGSGNITVVGNASAGNGLFIDETITATGGDVFITGTTSSAVNPNAGVVSDSTVQARNITLSASATAVDGGALGYNGAGGVFNASEALSLSGTSASSGNGFYSLSGSLTSGTGMTISGTSALGQGIGLDNAVTLTNGSTGGISITGTASDSTREAIGLRGSAMTNGGGDIVLTAISGNIVSTVGNPGAWGGVNRTNTITNNGAGVVRVISGNHSATNSGAVDGTVLNITQNGNAGVEIRSAGTGHVTAPRIVNAGTGNIVVAAGTAIGAGTGTGGQVLTLNGNTLSHTNATPGKTYIYTGQASGTGQLGHLSSAFNSLYYQGSSHTLNAQFNTAYSSTIAGGANAQVLFRDTTAPSFSLSLNNISKTYGDADPTLAARNTALLSAYTGPATLTTSVNGANSGSNTFAVSAADVINGLTGTGRTAGVNVGTYAYTDVSGSAFNTTLSAQTSLIIAPRDITLTSITAATKVYDGTTVATINGGTFGNIVSGETLLLGGGGYFNSPNVNGVSTVTVDDVTTLTKPSGGSGSWTNYNLVTTGSITSSATGKITRAPLTATVNNSSIFVTQLASSAPDMGVAYSGFVNDEDVSVLSGLAVRNYTGAASYPAPAAGTHAGVFGLSQTPTAANYQITVVPGDLIVIPADKLLITIQSQAAEYGSQTAANSGTAALGSVSAQYCLDDTDCNGVNLVDLTLSKLSETRWKAADNTGSHVIFDTAVSTPSYSTGGYLKAGNYIYSASEIAPLSLFTNGVANFTGRAVNAGVLTINARELRITAANEEQLFTGSQLTQSLGMQGLLDGDDVGVTGLAQGTTNGSYMSNLVVGGIDRANYRLVVANGTLRIVGQQQRPNRPSRVDPQSPGRPLLPTDMSQGSSQASASLNIGSNPFELAGSNPSDLTDPKCNLEDLSSCRCDSMQPADGTRASVEMENTQVCYEPLFTSVSSNPGRPRP